MWVDGLIWLEVGEKSRYPLDLLQLPVFVLVTQWRKLVTKKIIILIMKQQKNLSQNKLQVASQGPTIYKVIYL